MGFFCLITTVQNIEIIPDVSDFCFTRKKSVSSVNVFLLSPTTQLIEVEKLILRVGNTWKLQVDATCVTQFNKIMHYVSCS